MSMDLYLRALDEPPDYISQLRRGVGPYSQWLEYYQQYIASELSLPNRARLAVTIARLPDWVSDERNLWAAWKHLSRHGSSAPGPDGVGWTDYEEPTM